eukprot:GILK01003621.1.p1 GENE.GILK01003621.1~~GILK01003621.1.p1  ORF type:complete len:264 (+),score=50.43 GILK01003621.1:70-792(+)
MESDEGTPRQLEEQWKTFGRDTEAGRMLFALYKGKNAPAINYPKLRTKSRESAKAVPKPCPQRAPVNVPKFGGYKPDPERLALYRLHAMGRKKQLETIMQEFSQFTPEQPLLRPGVDRQAEKQRLAAKFQFSRGVLPKGATMPEVAPPVPKTDKELDTIMLQRQADEQAAAAAAQAQQSPDELFDSIVAEIYDRQKFLEEMSELGMRNKYEAKIKHEIAERIGDLQRLRELTSDNDSESS